MADLPTRLDYYQIGRDYVTQRAKRIDPNLIDVEGSDVNLFVGVGSVLADAVTRQLGQAISNLLLDGAQEDDLDRYSLDRYQLPRKGASPSLATVRFSRLSAAGGPGTVPIGQKLKTKNGIEFISTTSASFAPGVLDGVIADVRAVQAGSITKVGANTIRQIVNPGTLWDTSLQVTNDVRSAGGEDVEDDETYRARIRNFWNTARRGILKAITFGALTVDGVVSAQAIEALTQNNMPARIVNLYIADSSGVANAALARVVSLALDEYRAAGIAVLISTSIPLIVPIQLALTFVAGVDTLTLTDTIRAAIVEFINSLPVNGSLLLSDLYSVMSRFKSDGLVTNTSSIVSPVGDLVPPVGQTLRTTLDQVTAVPA